jgi:hypothetical protein
LFFSCCESVAAPRATDWAIKYLQQTTSGATGNGLGITAKHLRRTTSGGAGNDLGTAIK